MYSVLDNYLLARLVREANNVFKFNELVDVSAEWPDDVRGSTQVIASLTSDTHTMYSPDNFYGTLYSYVSLANIDTNTYPGKTISWVTEDPPNVLLPGYYFIDNNPLSDGTGSELTVTPFLVDTFTFDYDPDELEIIMPDSFTTAEPASIRVQASEEGCPPRFLIEDNDYTVSISTGRIEFINDCLWQGLTITVEWCFWGTSSGPHSIKPGCVYNDIIPGVNLFTHYDIFEPDRQLIAIEGSRQAIAEVYSARWQVSATYKVFTRSTIDRGRVSDELKNALAFDIRNRLGTDGITVESIASSRNAEVQYDTPSEYTFQTDINFEMSVPWFVARTFLIPIRKVSIFVNAPDVLSDILAVDIEEPRLIFTTEFSAAVAPGDFARIK